MGLFDKRRHLKEIGDSSRLRGWARECYMEGLNDALRHGGHYGGMVLPFKRWSEQVPDADEVLDLGSGGGGPIQTLLEGADTQDTDLPRIVLSDLYPNLPLFKEIQDRFPSGRVGYLAQPVSATDAAARGYRLRSICSAFHHLTDEEATTFLRSALGSGAGVFIMEPFKRDLRHFLMILFSGPFPYMLAPWRTGKRSFLKILFGFFLPVIPLMIAIDGCISVLRMRSREELEELLSRACPGSVKFEYGECAYLGPFRSTYFWAVPNQADHPAAQN